jgi:hypothetical protein
MPNGDIFKLGIEGTNGGEPFVWGLGFISQSEQPDFFTDAQALFVAVNDILALTTPGSGFLTPLSVQCKIDQVRVSDVAPGVSASVVFPVGAVGANTVDDDLPPACSLCITWRDGLKGKEHRGRTYLSGLAEDSQNAGYWIAETQAWANDGFASPLIQMFGPGGAGSYVLALVHSQLGGVRLDPRTASPILSYSVHNDVRTLRRRGVGVRISRRPSAP